VSEDQVADARCVLVYNHPAQASAHKEAALGALLSVQYSATVWQSQFDTD